MKRALGIIAGLAVVGSITWACWPGDEAVAPVAPTLSADAEKPARTLAEQLDDVERDFEASDAGRGLVTGVIEDEAGQPIAGAEVRVFQAGSHPLDAATCPVCGQPILECTDAHTAHEVIAVIRAGKGVHTRRLAR